MASKTGRKASAAGKKGAVIPQEKDDGSRWIIVHADTGQQVYGGTGVNRAQAERLATGLQAPSALRQTVEAAT